MTVDTIDRRLADLASIDLPSLDALAAHLRRFDRKYVVSIELVEELLSVLDSDWTALEVHGARSFWYHSVYFDDPSLESFRGHIQQRRHRHKVRVRRYEDGSELLEVKLKTGRGLTDKHRTRRSSGTGLELTTAERDWIAAVIGGSGSADDLEPFLIVEYVRSTLVHHPTRERVTIDRRLSMAPVGGGRAESPIGDAVIVEVKTGAARGVASRTLLSLGERPTSFSKYCVGLAAVNGGLDRRMLDDALRGLVSRR